MNLGELLAELREGILNDRSDRTSGTSDYLWTDDTLVRYINEAQRRFATKALVIRDATTSEVCTITLATGVTEYTLHESVIALLSARHSTDTTDLIRAGHQALGAYRAPDTYIIDPAAYATLPPGKPLAFTTDEHVVGDDNDAQGVVTLRVYPAPSADWNGDTIKLRVIRKPINQLRATAPNEYPEIPADHHLEMLDWAAYLALRIVDQDAGNPRRAAEFAASFEEHVRAARMLVLRKLFAPTKWGFGRGGYCWEH